MRGTDDAGYAVGWTISDLVTLGAIRAVWVFAIWTPDQKPPQAVKVKGRRHLRAAARRAQN
jgi:hypothetical protein